MIWKGSQKNAAAAEVDALEMYNRAVQKGWAGEEFDLKKHFVRTNMRKGLNEERGKELRRLGSIAVVATAGRRKCLATHDKLLVDFRYNVDTFLEICKMSWASNK